MGSENIAIFHPGELSLSLPDMFSLSWHCWSSANMSKVHVGYCYMSSKIRLKKSPSNKFTPESILGISYYGMFVFATKTCDLGQSKSFGKTCSHNRKTLTKYQLVESFYIETAYSIYLVSLIHLFMVQCTLSLFTHNPFLL